MQNNTNPMVTTGPGEEGAGPPFAYRTAARIGMEWADFKVSGLSANLAVTFLARLFAGAQNGMNG